MVNQPIVSPHQLWWSADGLTFVPVDGTNPLPVTGSITASNPSVGPTGTTAPVQATEIGVIDGTGKLQGVSSTNPVPVSGSITITPADMLTVTGTISSAAVLSNFPKTDCTDYYTVSVQWTTITSGNTAVAEWSNDGTTWYTASDLITGVSSFTAVGAAVYGCYGKQFRLRCSVYSSGSVAATAGAVTVGSTTPKWSIGIPATAAANLARVGLAFANGIQVAATTTATGSTAPGTALDCNFSYH